MGVLTLPPCFAVKRAYYLAMKECHPDLAGDADIVTDFCKLLNDVYETLSDPAARAEYDEINGFSMAGAGPACLIIVWVNKARRVRRNQRIIHGRYGGPPA